MAEPWEGKYANDAYLRSLAASSSDVKRQTSNALSEIARQRMVAAAAASGIPGAANVAMDRGSRQFTADNDRLGLTGPTSGSRVLPSLQDAFRSGKESFKRTEGLIQQGFGERQARQTGGAKMVSQQLINDLRSKGNEFVSGREREDQQRAWQAAENAKQRALQQQIANQQAAAMAAAAEAQRREGELGRQHEIAMEMLDGGVTPPGWSPQQVMEATGWTPYQYMAWVAQNQPAGPRQRPTQTRERFQ